jgi:hypothetical protein
MYKIKGWIRLKDRRIKINWLYEGMDDKLITTVNTQSK